FVGSPSAAIDGLIASQLDGKLPPGVTITNAEELNDFVQDSQQELAAGRDRVRQAEAAIAANPALESILRPQIVAGQAEIAAGEERLAPLQGLNGYAASQLSNTEGTKVEVRSENISAILGMKLGANKNF